VSVMVITESLRVFEQTGVDDIRVYERRSVIGYVHSAGLFK